MSQTCGTRSTSTLAAPMATLLKTSRLHWSALSCESACFSYCMHQFRRICCPVSARHLLQFQHILSHMHMCFTSLPHSMLLGPYACMHFRSTRFSAARGASCLLARDCDQCQLTMHTYVPAELFARYFADFSLSEFALFTCNVGSIFDAMLC